MKCKKNKKVTYVNEKTHIVAVEHDNNALKRTVAAQVKAEGRSEKNGGGVP